MRSSEKGLLEWSALMHCVMKQAQKHLLMTSVCSQAGAAAKEVGMSQVSSGFSECSSNEQAALYAIPVRSRCE